ncbi:MAG: cell division protein ZapE [Micavibrio sp.]|nr:MAG: cell division protein ZapE [Micavibrio sp.]
MSKHQTPLELYQERIKDGALNPDPVQKAAVASLQRLYGELIKAHEDQPKNLFEKITGLVRRSKDAPKGVYMHGGVGRGKSMVMDMFYDCLPDDMHKTRIHFHAFMIDVHDYMHSRRKDESVNEDMDSALPALAERIAERSRILCFDEFHVTDVADAMILGRLFTALFELDVVVVATTNWEPDRLYEGGLQRERFLPFIQLLKDKLEIVHLDSPTDYRAQCLREEGTYFYPLGSETRRQANGVFNTLTDNMLPEEDEIEVKGRTIKVEATAKNVARFSFAQLCEQPHGAEDYLEIAKKYPTIFLEGVPKLGYDRRNEAKRLMILIDALYESGTKLVVTADAPPDKLYQGHDHGFEFQRTVSRLLEMQSAKYLEKSP